MDFAAVYHKTTEQMSYALDEDHLVVNLKTGYDVKQVFIAHGEFMPPGSWAEMKDGAGSGKRSFIRSVCPIRSGGRPLLRRLTNGANIILNSIQMMKSGITSRTAS